MTSALTHLVTTVATGPHSISPTEAVRRLIHPAPGLRETVTGKVVLITGASSGIGEAAAREIGSAGATVVLVARREAELKAIADDIVAAGGKADVHPCDLSDTDAIDELVGAVLAKHGAVDVLINNAGRSIRRSLDLSYDRFHDFERTMQLNYFAALRLILALLPAMREQHRGHIINISSAGVVARTPRFGAYIASKAALDTLSDAFQAETRSDGVRFTTIHMPLVRTPMISPTALYDHLPALRPTEAGHIIAEAIVNRPRRLTPAVGRAMSVADWIAPEFADFVREQAAKLSGESAPKERS